MSKNTEEFSTLAECTANKEGGQFVAAPTVISLGIAANSVSAITTDFDHDRSPILYIVNANLPDQLYLNSAPQSEGCWEAQQP